VERGGKYAEGNNMSVLSFSFYIAMKEVWRNRGRFFLLSLVIALITLLVLFIAALGKGWRMESPVHRQPGAQLIVFREKSDTIIPQAVLTTAPKGRAARQRRRERGADLHSIFGDRLDEQTDQDFPSGSRPDFPGMPPW